MKKYKTKPLRMTHKYVLMSIICSFLLCTHNISAQGPNAPEAGAFEPVDATDMVNLVTGNMSYVLPLLNVPSPEGGYPLALSYHAGIAMDQEASWVGLGWNLNPGAINRSVNGYPDDWGKTYVGEFFYDKEWEENYYNFSVGGTLPNGITLGVGGSWGSNQAFGGIVSIGYAGFTADIGVAGNSGYYGVGYRSGGFSYGMSTQGVNIGYGQSFGGVGLNTNYNSNSGFSGSVSVGTQIGTRTISAGASVGISFNSSGVNLSGSANINGLGTNNSNSSISSNDYNIDSNTRGLNLDFGAFWIGYRHKEIKYSLFKVNNLYVTGTLYPYATKRTQRVLKNGSIYDTFFQEFDYAMDTYSTSIRNSTDNKDEYKLPSYDNYSVNAQGLSATIQPRTFDEMILYGNGNYEKENTASLSPLKSYNKFIVDTFANDYDTYKLGNKTHFYFTNSYNSFLRTKRKFNDFLNIDLYNLESGFHALASKTSNSIEFSQNTTPNGNKIRGGVNNYRKRGGAYIETFTNKEIRGNNVLNFIEAKNLETERNNTETFIDESIGAYKITTIDGKTYHYSLPVYHYENFYKSFKDDSDENKNFYEQKKLKPYATHWLLTAVTGPDYFDANNNGIVDNNDYGYWVEFEYGKWSDGFAWRGPKGTDFNTIKRKVGPWAGTDDITNSYSWGRKQIYYLDKIKTRTHTALFIKDLRADNLSSLIDINSKYYNGSSNFDIKEYGQNIRSPKKKNFSLPGEVLYNTNNLTVEMPYEPIEGNVVHSNGNVVHYEAYIENQKYIYLPKTKSLRLSKIILLKNDDLPSNNEQIKSLGNLTNVIEGKLYINDEYNNVRAIVQHNNVNQYISLNGTYFRNKKSLKTVYSQLHNNIIDVSDIQSLGLEKKALKVIDFNIEYQLGGNIPNSQSPGNKLLTLKSLNTRGKNGISITPPFKFEYNKPSTLFNRDDIDNWGYHKTDPDSWSLNKIITPTGGKIDISYESDSYEIAALGPSSGDNPFTLTTHGLTNFNAQFIERIEKGPQNDPYVKIYYKNNVSLEHDLSFYFTPGEIASVGFSTRGGDTGPLGTDSYPSDLYKIRQTQGKEWVLIQPTEEARYYDYLVTNTEPQEHLGLYLSSFSLTSIKSSYIIDDPNGRKKGGIRVADIKVSDDTGNALTTEYSYRNPINNIISGVTSYEPEDTFEDGYEDHNQNSSFISEIPAPGVNYEFVKVSTKDANNNLIGYSQYHFDVLKPIGEFLETSQVPISGTNFVYVRGGQDETTVRVDYINEQGNQRSFDYNRNVFGIEDKSSFIGRVKSIKNFNKKNQLISCTINDYENNLDQDGELGVTQESFLTYTQHKKTISNIGIFDANSSIVSKSYYPSKLESTTTIQGGFTNTTYYDKHDFLTGQVLETRTVSSEGDEFKTKITPAYQIGGYTDNTNGHSMGPKVDNPTNKNMLTQTAATLTQIKDASGDWKTINASINTWNNDWTYRNYNGSTTTPTNDAEKIWRKHQTFAWKGEVDEDGAYAGYTGDDDNFNWLDPNDQSNAKWIKTSTVSLYDHYSMPLESIDINENKASTKMGDDNSKVFAVANAGYTEMYYSGAEDLIDNTNYFSGEVYKGSTATLSDTYHTGSKAIQVSANAKAFAVTPKAGNYKVSVWAYKGSNTNYTNTKLRAGSTTIAYHPAEVIPAGDWIQLNFYTNDIGANQEVYVYTTSGTVIYDDFRLVPIASSMSSYVYNEWDELTYIIGANNLATKYEYDDAGRLHKTYSEVMDTPEIRGGFKLNKEINYNYGNPTSNDTTNPNALSLSLGIGNANTSTTTLTATANGGSYEYEYRFAIGTSSSNLSYGSWTSSNTRSLTTNCTSTGRRYYKCQVRDKNSGATKESTGNHQRGNCGIGDDDDPIDIIQQ
ncbi:hypothetical protein J8L88_06780 [Aquimarina sp. MMG015]|uniref:hypothetical protein n=1 Tax=Aquimarina sp. MMG015 TaxID=2822689 RepID=UPI001B3A4FB5|nr:hypothetical protein [Aquimarina sp. MMG015]MBQ4802557.1 hypothetical protein [Aquimarina sp. MMG015]